MSDDPWVKAQLERKRKYIEWTKKHGNDVVNLTDTSEQLYRMIGKASTEIKRADLSVTQRATIAIKMLEARQAAMDIDELLAPRGMRYPGTKHRNEGQK